MLFSRCAHSMRRATLLSSSAAVAAATAVTLHDDREKLPIYPPPEREILLVETPSALEKQIGEVRRSLTSNYWDAYGRVQGVVSSWIGIEHAVELRLKSFAVPSEPLTPAILYIGIAALSGSILARNRSLLTRLILPPTLFIGSSYHFLPKTTSNITAYCSSLEDTYFPTLADKHRTANAHTLMGWEMLKERTRDAREGARGVTERAVRSVQDVTGLKVGDAFGVGREVARKAERGGEEVKSAVEEAKKVVEGKIEEVREKAEKKVNEKDRLV